MCYEEGSIHQLLRKTYVLTLYERGAVTAAGVQGQ